MPYPITGTADKKNTAPSKAVGREPRSHTALTKDAWRQSGSCCLPHTAQSLGHAFSRSVSGTCEIERCSPQSASFPPQPPQRVTLRCSVGSLVLRRSPTSPERSCPPFGLWPSRTGLDLSVETSRRSLGSRACCFSACAGSSTTQDRSIRSRLARLSYCLPPVPEGSRHPDPSHFRSSIAGSRKNFVSTPARRPWLAGAVCKLKSLGE